jgi:gallate decarboxylase subunit D
MNRWTAKVSKGGFTIHALIQKMGQDILVSIWGGTHPHIGAVAMAVPRPSLKDPKEVSATSSNFTFVGHKEDLLAKKISEKISSQLKTNVIVTAGIHWDKLPPSNIATIEKLTEALTDLILKKLGGKK